MLDRFVEAQANGVYEQAVGEIRAGRKRTHWMWFIFPQLEGLGSSKTARYFAIADRAGAKAYLEHPLLGARLRAAAEAVLESDTRPEDLFGYPDWLKLRSSTTLFAAVAEPESVFARLLRKHFNGQADVRTLELLDDRDPRG